jgi:hypothetical protein
MEQLVRTDLRHGDGRRLFVYGRYDGHQPEPLPADEGTAELHLRHDALTDRWVAISPARNTRPQSRAGHDDSASRCPLCPGGPEVSFPYDAAVFENRFPTLLATPPAAPDLDGRTAPSVGRCEVVLYTPTHEGSLATLVWRYAPASDSRPPVIDRAALERMATTEESTALSRELKRRGFTFVGPTTCYAFMQATGMVDDHLADCWVPPV